MSASHPSIRKLIDLIDLERSAEIEEARRLQEELTPRELELEGRCLLHLKVIEERGGPGGRELLVLAPSRQEELPAHRFQNGDIVAISPMRREGRGGASSPSAGWNGVVYSTGRSRITVALQELPEETPAESLRLDRLANDVTYQRMLKALEQAQSGGRGPAARLRDMLLGLREPGPPDRLPDLKFFNESLNDSQRQAVAFALAASEAALIHGPPGTGKTTAVVELIRQAIHRKEKVLACAPSNIAVDNMAEKLAAAGVRVVRLGHPARMMPEVLGLSMDACVERAEGTQVAAVIRRELDAVHRKLRRCRERDERYRLRGDLRRLRDELREMERNTVKNILSSAEAVLATNTGAADSWLEGLEFDRVVIDEAAQALEPSCWIPILKGRRAVLSGDHRQLPPTIISQAAAARGLSITLFDRLARAHGDRMTRLLAVQYRMHETLQAWPSQEFYEGKLIADVSVRGHLLADLPGVADDENTRTPLLFIDTAGCGFEEAREEKGESRSNPGEARLVRARVESLTAAGVSPGAIAVISPYNAQVALLRRLLEADHPGLEIDSIDGFQGREKEAVVISLVRSNPEGEIGFLSDDRRTNVAITRARRQAIIIGDSATISRHPTLNRLVEFCEKQGAYKSAWEFPLED